MKPYLLIAFFTSFLLCCKEKKTDLSVNNAPIVIKKDKPRSKTDTLPSNAPIINIADSVSQNLLILCIKDSAKNSVRLSEKLAKIYGIKLPEFIKKNKLKTTGAPMAWYKTQKSPFFFEAGIPIDKKPAKLPKGFIINKIGGYRNIIAHYFGPYEETSQAYDALKDWLKENHKNQVAPAYEIYVGDPYDKEGKPIDPYKVQTDIIIPYH
jgi:effector-binding domain-containing protein